MRFFHSKKLKKMSSYLKIYSKVKIDRYKMPGYNARFFLDYDRQEDEEGEEYRYEYFFKLNDDEDDDSQLQAEFEDECKSLLKWLDENISPDNYFFTNMSGVYLP
jgi:hypothetical protein